MRYYECPGCCPTDPGKRRPTRLANFEGGATTRCPVCGSKATRVGYNEPSGLPTDYRKPVSTMGPASRYPKPARWIPGRTRRTAGMTRIFRENPIEAERWLYSVYDRLGW